MNSSTYSGQTILITGASSGIGAEFARRLAARGASLVLVARRADRLEALASELVRAHGVQATAVPADLLQTGAVASLRSALDAQGIAITGLINNAGFGKRVPLHEQDPDDAHDMVTLNVTALADLTREFLPDLRRAPRGLLVNIASVAAYQPIPTMAVYGASKAFVLSFTEAVWAESRGTRLRVLAVSPGPTDTEFFDVAGHSADGGLPRVGASVVVDQTLRALERRTTPPSLVVGRLNTAAAQLPRILPRSSMARALGRLMASRGESTAAPGGDCRAGHSVTEPFITENAATWRAWLDEHENTSDGVWLVLAKKGTAHPTSLTYQEALEEALCSGWIDGQLRSRDETTFLRRFTPRRPRSLWSARNVEIIARLDDAGRMRPRGWSEVEKAQADGRWDRAYAGSADAVVPEDLAEALALSPRAQEAFGRLTKSQRYSVIHPVMTAATPSVRAARIRRQVERLSEEGTAQSEG